MPASGNELGMCAGVGRTHANTNARNPYCLPSTAPSQLSPPYLDCQPIELPVAQSTSARYFSESEDDPEPTTFALFLELLERLRAMVGDHLLIEHHLVNGVVYNHATRLFEMALPELPVPQSPWLVSFALIDAARSAATLANTDFLTWVGFASLVNHARERLREIEPLAGTPQRNWRLAERFDDLCHRLADVRPQLLRDPNATGVFLNDLLRYAGIGSTEDERTFDR